MLKTIKRLLRGPLPTIDAIDKAASAIDIPTLEATLAEAQQRRAAILLDGSVDDILAAERKVDEARIELERAHIALEELERRRVEANAKARRGALEHRHAEVQAQVDHAVARIEAEYPKHAQAIAELAALAGEADAAAGAWFHDLQECRTEDLAVVEPVAKRLGWHDEYFNPPIFADAPVLPPVGTFDGTNVRWPTKVEMWAVYGSGSPPSQAA